MNDILTSFNRLLSATKTNYIRSFHNDIDWSNRLIAITGARGVGKTTLMLQHIKTSFPNKEKVLYVSLDNVWFTTHSIINLVDKLYNNGATHLFIDEVHRYPNWAIEIKNIYDSYPGFNIVFTGSSMLEIYNANADLSRRAIAYELDGLSFREFIYFEKGIELPSYSLDEIITSHADISASITEKIKPLAEFDKYLRHGFYPFYKENISSYGMRLHNVVNTILDNDLPAVENIEYNTIFKIKKLLMILTSLVPYSPNLTKLSTEIETNRASTIKFLHLLQRARLIKMLIPVGNSMSLMNKPDKIYIDNTNIIYALGGEHPNKGNLRETFFANQCAVHNTVNTTKDGDFIVNEKYTFEIGGKNKTYRQIKDIAHSYIAMDDIEYGFSNKIPLYLFGFLK